MADRLDRLRRRLASAVAPGPAAGAAAGDRVGGGLVPIVVGATGRSGTTLLMQLLGTSRQVAFDRIYAFEHGYLSYLWQWCRLPEEGAVAAPDWRRAAIDQQDWLAKHGKSGGVPWQDRPALRGDGARPFSHEVLAAVWPLFSARARAYHAREVGGTATHYAETGPPWLLGELAGVFDELSGIYLLRDPRDQWLSMMSFMDRTGNASFGWQPDDTPETFAQRIADQQRDTFATVAGLGDDPAVRVVHYESLVEDLDAEAGRLADWLGLDLDPQVVRRREGSMRDHRTATGGSSVGRWRDEMSPDIRAVFHDTMARELEVLGYPVS